MRHLHNFRLHAKPNFCKIGDSLKSGKFEFVLNYFPDLLREIVNLKHSENNSELKEQCTCLRLI